jgi:hypothetical protein
MPVVGERRDGRMSWMELSRVKVRNKALEEKLWYR